MNSTWPTLPTFGSTSYSNKKITFNNCNINNTYPVSPSYFKTNLKTLDFSNDPNFLNNNPNTFNNWTYDLSYITGLTSFSINNVKLTAITSTSIFWTGVTNISLQGRALDSQPSLSALSLSTFASPTNLTLNVSINRISGFTNSNSAPGLKTLTYTNNYFSTNGWFSPSFPSGLTFLDISSRQDTNTINIVFSSNTAYSGFNNVLKTLNITNFKLSAASVNYITCWLATAQTYSASVTGGTLNYGNVFNATSNSTGNQQGDATSGGLNGVACRQILTGAVGNTINGFSGKGWSVAGTAAPQ